jgi:hypothetical protein
VLTMTSNTERHLAKSCRTSRADTVHRLIQSIGNFSVIGLISSDLEGQ